MVSQLQNIEDMEFVTTTYLLIMIRERIRRNKLGNENHNKYDT